MCLFKRSDLKTNPVTFYRNFSDAQKQRFKNHTASVRLNEQGELEVLEEEITNPNGQTKNNRLIRVLPESNETIRSFRDSGNLFSDLSHLNVILTNACNLSCTYCYEQHNKDYGRFTVESLRKAWDWLLTVNNRSNKEFQFFGGEPLIHKKLILDFMDSDPDHFQDMFDNGKQQLMSICTNGLLMDKTFIDEYFSRSYTSALISLDTTRAEIDHRQIGQEEINKLLDHIDYIPLSAKLDRRVVVRCTLSQEAAPYMNEFIDEIYKRGIRQMIVHPLILDSTRGFISWQPEQWQGLHNDILMNLDKYFDLQIKFVEGIGKKKESNCMVGSDMIAIDASGDFSGCYFFTNMKTDGTGHTILGNVFNDLVYTDRYKSFQKIYNEMFETEEQCRSCDYRQACYQCPAGNSDTGSKLFRPDDMCQKIVKLYIDLQDDVNKKTFMREYQKTLGEAAEIGFDKYISAGLTMLGKLYFENINAPLKSYIDTDLPYYKKVVTWFLANLTVTTDISSVTQDSDIVVLYRKIVGDTASDLGSAGDQENIFYLNAIGQAIINQRLNLKSTGFVVR